MKWESKCHNTLCYEWWPSWSIEGSVLMSKECCTMTLSKSSEEPSVAHKTQQPHRRMECSKYGKKLLVLVSFSLSNRHSIYAMIKNIKTLTEANPLNLEEGYLHKRSLCLPYSNCIPPVSNFCNRKLWQPCRLFLDYKRNRGWFL